MFMLFVFLISIDAVYQIALLKWLIAVLLSLCVFTINIADAATFCNKNILLERKHCYCFYILMSAVNVTGKSKTNSILLLV